MSATNLSCLDCLQNRSFQLITGQLVSTPLKALRLEADVQNYQTYSNRLILKALRSTDDHPKRVALAADTPRCSFRCKANNISTLSPVGLEHRETINHSQSPPWQLNTPRKKQISTSVPGIAGRAEDIDLKRQCSLTLIASYQANYTIYADGSATG